MPIRRRCVYAFLFVTCGEFFVCAESPTCLILPFAETSGAAGSNEVLESAEVPLRSNPIWWGLVELQISMLCMVLDCDGQNQPPSVSDGAYESVKDLMREQIRTYWARGLRPELSTLQVESARKCVVELISAMGTAPAELNADLRNDYTRTLESIRDDLSAL